MVDTGSHWSTFGEVLLLVLAQIGGIGIMTLASLLAMMVSSRMGLQLQLTVKTETNTLNLGQVRRVVLGVVVISLVVEAVGAVVLGLRFWLGHGYQPGQAFYSGVFHPVSAFNSVGLSLYPDSLMRFATDPWVCLPVVAVGVIGGLGFPALFEVLRGRRRKRWSPHTRITVPVYLALIAVGTLVVLGIEWARAGTLGPYSVGEKLLISIFHGAQPSTAGFNSLDVSQLQPATVLVDFGISDIWAKAISREHGRILERIGAHHVVLPEHEMGERVAHLVTGRMLDFIEFEDDYAMIKTRAPQEAVGKTLGQSMLRKKYGVTVVGVKRPGEGFTYATAETVVHAGDVLIVAGRTSEVERLAELT